MTPKTTFKGSRLRMTEAASRSPEDLVTHAGDWPALEAFRFRAGIDWV